MSDDDHDFDGGDAGAEGCIPKQAGEIRKGAYAMLKHDFPCRIVDYSTSKTGKHGHAKAHIIGIDIFTGKKHEDLCPTSHNMMVPLVTKNEYTLMDIADDGNLSLLTGEGESKDDLFLPELTDEHKAISKQIKEMFEEGKGVRITTMCAIGKEVVCAVQEDGK